MFVPPTVTERRRYAVLALLVLGLVWGAAAAGPELAGVGNFHKVNDQVYRGAQPCAQGFRNLAQLGVKTVIDLRGGGRSAGEQRVVEAAGMRYVNMPWSGLRTPTPDQVSRLLAILNDSSAGPVFVHCRRGADRTGTAIACYRILHDHWDNRKALAEAKAYGMSWVEHGMHEYVLHYQAGSPSASAAAPAASQ